MSDVKLVKDRKGSTWLISHRRCGVTEVLFFTVEELTELRNLIDNVL